MERVATGYSIVEGPTWEPATDRLVFADGYGGAVWALGPNGATEIVIPKRHCSGIALHERGGYVVSGRNVGWKHGEHGARLLELDPAWGMAFFNDLGTDLAGRVYVGSVDYDPAQPERTPKPGYLHVIDLDGSSRIVADGIGTANGVAVSPDGGTLYFNDTWHRCVWRFNVMANGDLAGRGCLIEFDLPDGQGPDGIAVASDGSIWVALAGAGCVAVVEADGRERMRLDVPQAFVTSLCFGGADLKTLYVTTHASMHTEESKVQPDGSVYRTRVDVAGMPVPLARVGIPD